jgi:hypothetical protein
VCVAVVRMVLKGFGRTVPGPGHGEGARWHTWGVAAEAGHARCTYRLRVPSTARTALAAEWDRCRWVWNECVAKSRAVHLHNKATGEKQTERLARATPITLRGFATDGRHPPCLSSPRVKGRVASKYNLSHVQA